VAGANYEVNIQLKADPALKSLERIEQKINKLTKTSVDLQDARGAAMVKNRNLADQINKLEEKGVNVAKMRERLGKAIEKTDKSKLQTAAAHRGIVKNLIKDETKLLSVKENQLKIDQQQQRQRRGAGGPGRFGEAVLGGGFPLLFGGSPFQALGGAIGGAFGGFAGGIGAQVAVGQIENLFVKAAELGQGLNRLNFDLQGVTEAAGFAGTETAQLLERIEQYGDSAVAARLATELLEKRIGIQGVKALKDFGEKAGELGRALSTIFTQVLAGIAQAAGPLLDSLARFAGEQAAIGAFKARTDLTGADEFARQILTGEGLPQGPGARRARILSKSRELGLGITTERQAREFARQRAVGSQEMFELPTIQEIEFEASQVQDPAQKRAASKAERQQLKEFLEKNKQITRELERQDKLNELAGKHIADQLNAADQINQSQDARRAKLEGIITGTEKETALKQAILQIQQKGLLPADEERLIAAEKQLYTMERQAEQVQKIRAMYEKVGAAIETGISSALQSVINKTESLGDAVRGVLVDIGNMLLRMGIETAVKAGFSALTSGGSSPAPYTPLPGSVPLIAATGAYVSGPTNAVIGEGGQGEYVIPESKMRESMARYSRGARGASVIPESGESGTVGGGGGIAVAAPIDVRYTVERINDVEYVTAAQFQAGMQQAAAQGAQRGEQQTLRRLQMSGSTRRRIGL
jgi:hypothetical protein